MVVGEMRSSNVAQAFEPATFLSAAQAGWKACLGGGEVTARPISSWTSSLKRIKV